AAGIVVSNPAYKEHREPRPRRRRMLPTRVLSAQAQIRLRGNIPGHRFPFSNWGSNDPTHATQKGCTHYCTQRYHSGGSMRQTSSSPGSRAILLLLLLTGVTWASLAGAQAGTIGGTITDARSGLPISD